MPRRKSDARTKKVEEWKKSPQTKDFLGRLKQLARVRQALEMQGLQLSDEVTSVRELYRQLMISYDGLLSAQPKEMLNELPGMNFDEEETPKNWRVNY